MATLLSLKTRMKTASNVSKTTKAMQMIAASKLKKAQEGAESSKPYVEKLDILTKAIEGKLDKENLHQFMIEPQVKAKLLIVISPDKGLCGGLVTNLTREILHFSNGNDKIYYLTIGTKAEKTVASLNKDVIASFPFGTTLPQFESVFPVLKIIEEYFIGKKVSQVIILSTKFNGVLSQSPKFNTLLPVKLNSEAQSLSQNTLFEPNIDQILPDLLKHYLEMVIYQSLLESYASEQSSRMIAMKNATDNANDIISDLRLEYNKTRQEKITNELLDIGGGSQISI